MKTITQHYINGQFVDSIGQEKFNLVNPSTSDIIGTVTLGNEVDARNAIAAAKAAFKTYSRTTIDQRVEYLQRLHDAILARQEDHKHAILHEYGASNMTAQFILLTAAGAISTTIKLIKEMPLTEMMGTIEVSQNPMGVAGLITPWNANIFFFCLKAAPALAAGCTVVVKPSEMSGIQTQVIMECVHAAKLPPGVINIVNGRGDVVGTEITEHPDVAKISFTGSCAVGKKIMRAGAPTLKRLTLELGGKSAHIILDDADLSKALPFTTEIGFLSNGQYCGAGTRILVPESRLEEVKAGLKKLVGDLKVGPPEDPSVKIGPLVSKTQWDRIQGYIKKGIAEGAEVLTGGPGHPEGLENGCFVKPTIFVNVKNSMTIAQEEIFGPVLCVITYKTEEEAIEIANDSTYGLAGYVSSENVERAKRVASQVQAGSVWINKFTFDPLVPFGGFKQSGIGREAGVASIKGYLETKAILV